MGLAVVLEVEYATESEEEARQFAHRDAALIFRQDDVDAVTADLASAYAVGLISSSGKRLPITERYLEG